MSEPMPWHSDLELGIEVLDEQHKAIVFFYNELLSDGIHGSPEVVARISEELVRYTDYHFEFEEYLMARSGYEYLEPHRKIHRLFIRKLEGYQQRIEAGQDIVEELGNTLWSWLVRHIREEDADYVMQVAPTLKGIVRGETDRPDTIS